MLKKAVDNPLGKNIGYLEIERTHLVDIYQSVVGGRIYTTSEYGAEHVIWDTNIVDVDTLQQCLVHEQTLRSIK